MKETKLKSFEFAADLTKQLITLSAILVGISITFFEKFENDASRWILIWSWILFLVSVVFGILTLMTLTGSLGRIEDDTSLKSANIYNRNNTIFSIFQIILFVIGLSLLILYGSHCETKTKTNETKEKPKVELFHLKTKKTAPNISYPASSASVVFGVHLSAWAVSRLDRKSPAIRTCV